MTDIIIIFIILLIVALVFKRFDNTIIFFGLLDIFFRIANYIGNHTIKELGNFVNKYLPNSIPSVISKYSSGIIETILVWGYIVLMIMFLYYVFKMLLRRI